MASEPYQAHTSGPKIDMVSGPAGDFYAGDFYRAGMLRDYANAAHAAAKRETNEELYDQVMQAKKSGFDDGVTWIKGQRRQLMERIENAMAHALKQLELLAKREARRCDSTAELCDYTSAKNLRGVLPDVREALK